MYRKNRSNSKSSYFSSNMINILEDEDADERRRRRHHDDEVKILDDSYKCLSQVKFDDSSQPYIDYFTCREYNKKVRISTKKSKFCDLF